MSQRSLKQWLDYLEQLHPSEIELGLQRIQTVAQRLGLTRPAPTVVTVTGTNGKGSTCAFLAQLCMAQSMRVGVYSSPHFLAYNERIQIGAEPVADTLICAAFVAIEQAREDISLTYFEVGTLAALWVFEQQPLDIVILEVGLGGRLDAVNIIAPDLAVITSIAVDHTDWLGDTRESIGYEKAGIFRAHTPALCGDLAPPNSVLTQAKKIAAPLILRGRDFDLALEDNCWHWRGLNAAGESLELTGLPALKLPPENAALALQAYALLDLPWQADSLARALQNTRLQGRLQVVRLQYREQPRTLILDVAHNPQAADYFAHWLSQRPLAGQRYAVFGALADKDVPAVVKAMHGAVHSWAVAALPTPRSYAREALKQQLIAAGEQVITCDSIVAALEHQLDVSTAADEIVVFGSFFTVTQVLAYLREHDSLPIEYDLP